MSYDQLQLLGNALVIKCINNLKVGIDFVLKVPKLGYILIRLATKSSRFIHPFESIIEMGLLQTDFGRSKLSHEHMMIVNSIVIVMKKIVNVICCIPQKLIYTYHSHGNVKIEKLSVRNFLIILSSFSLLVWTCLTKNDEFVT